MIKGEDGHAVFNPSLFIFDTKKVNFDEVTKKGSLVRCCGGRKVGKENKTNPFMPLIESGKFSID